MQVMNLMGNQETILSETPRKAVPMSWSTVYAKASHKEQEKEKNLSYLADSSPSNLDLREQEQLLRDLQEAFEGEMPEALQAWLQQRLSKDDITSLAEDLNKEDLHMLEKLNMLLPSFLHEAKLADNIQKMLELLEEPSQNFAASFDVERMTSEQVQLATMKAESSESLSIDIQSAIIHLLQEVETLLTQFIEGNKEVPRHILQLLHKWLQLDNQAPSMMAEMKGKMLTEKEAHVWQQLVESYEKRQALSQQKIYQTEATLTRQDVHRWLAQALQQYEGDPLQARPSLAQSSLSAMPMSAIQQQEILEHSINRIERISNELITQLTTVMQRSDFTLGKHMQQLTITLNPENLGSMTVRFVEINGEMTVKLLVSTSLAQKSLESNIHQLKHLFAPHQIMIERQEGVTDEEYFQEEESFEESFEEHQKESQKEDEEKVERNFEEMLDQIREEEILHDEN